MTQDSLPATAEPEQSAPRIPELITRYSLGYKPTFEVSPIIKRMIESVPPKYLVGLSKIVLTDRGELARKRRRSVTYSRKKKVRILKARGLYHPAWKGNRAWIEIFVDATLGPWEKGLWLKIPAVREMVLDEVLFHEIGHHIHYDVRPEYREKEDVADVWKVRLERNYWRRRFSLIRLFIRLMRVFAGPMIDWLHFKMMKFQLEKGLISRAEFEESTRE